MGTFGRYDELPLDKMSEEQRAGYDYLVGGRGKMIGPYRVWMHNPKLLRAASHLGAHFIAGANALTEREREIAVIVITAQLRSDYPTAAHEKRGKEIGLGDARVEAMVAGLPVTFEDEQEQLVYEVAVSLASNRIISDGLHARAVKTLGHERISDTIMLMAYYTGVSMTMNFYAVPAGTPGLQR